MKKTVEIKKRIDFSSMIGEVCAISLENHLKFIDDENIKGEFIVFGRYKSTTASRLEEDFQYSIPVEIALTERVDASTGSIDVANFYYDIVEGESLLCNIEVTIDAAEYPEVRECDGDPAEDKEIEIPHIEEVVEEEREEEEPVLEEKEEVSIFPMDSKEETYGTFIVYIVREQETINSILEKYHTTIEEIEKYNDIKNLDIGTKIIIPVSHESDS